MTNATLYLLYDKRVGLYKIRWALANTVKTLKLYKPPSTAVHTWSVNLRAMNNIEKAILKKFKEKYLSAHGSHWFDGDQVSIKRDIDNIIADSVETARAYTSDEVFWGMIGRS
jgi:hypothetical protein